MMTLAPVTLAANPAVLFNNPIPIISNTDPVIGETRVSLQSSRLLSDGLQTLRAERFGSADAYLAKFKMAN
jgi:hypothetical protein